MPLSFTVGEMKDYSVATVREFLISNGIKPGITIDFDSRVSLLKKARTQWDDSVAQGLMNLFMPDGEPIAPGFEDSLSHYVFSPVSWEQFEKEWGEWIQEGAPEDPPPLGTIPR